MSLHKTASHYNLNLKWSELIIVFKLMGTIYKLDNAEHVFQKVI